MPICSLQIKLEPHFLVSLCTCTVYSRHDDKVYFDFDLDIHTILLRLPRFVLEIQFYWIPAGIKRK